jgi:HlyD family secretion protein
MKLKLAALGLIVLGLGAGAFAMVGPIWASSSGVNYIYAQATVGAVSAQSVATGTIAASTVYGLKFGAAPDVVSSAGTTSGSGSNSSAANNSSGNSSSNSSGNSSGAATVTWPVKTATVTVGQTVKKGDVLASADDSAAQLQLTSAQATLASAQAKLATDQGGPNATVTAQARDQVNQAQNGLNQAVAGQKLTSQQNSLTLSQAQSAVSAAQAKLATDTAATAPQPTLDQDQAALSQAQASLASTQLKIDQSNQQAAQQVTSAQLQVSSAQHQYDSKVAPAASATILADQAQVATAQAAVASAQAAVAAATIAAPGDGLIVAVNVIAGVNAPSGYAIEESVAPMVANASFAESAVASLKVGQAATVAVTAAKKTVNGTLTQIVPVASSAGSSSGVVSYTVTVTLTDPPVTVLSGMSAVVTVTTSAVANTLRVPATALQGSAATGYSVQVKGSGGVTSQAVEVGLITTSYAQISNGIAEGQEVVVGTTTARTGTTTTGAGTGLGGNGLSGLTGAGGLGR